MSEETTNDVAAADAGCCSGASMPAPGPSRGDVRSADADGLRDEVREGYAKIAEAGGMGTDAAKVEELSLAMGYEAEDLEAVPEGANLGVGCGNPTAIDSLAPGQTVLDLGSGAGMDAFLAARQVGPEGRVIGVDMTDEMLEKARANAAKAGIDNVEFRKGFIEDLPVDDASIDVILSNCVINLSPEKDKVYREAYRVLRSGGRAMISDIVLERELPDAVVSSIDAWIGCVGGASLRERYLETIREAGFREVRVESESSFVHAVNLEDPEIRAMIDRLGITTEDARGYADSIRSLHIFARK